MSVYGEASTFGVLVLFATRGVLFLSCRKYLLSSLYSDLQDLSGDDVREGKAKSSMEMAELPAPNTQQRKGNGKGKGRGKGTFHSMISRATFSICFSESCMMFLLLMAQGMDMFSAGERLLNWKFSLSMLLISILVLVPLSVSLVLTVGSDHTIAVTKAHLLPRAFFSLIFVSSCLFGLSYIPLPANFTSPDLLTGILSRLIVLGTLILGVLSGFGAISSSWVFIPSKRKSGIPSDSEVEIAERALDRIRDDLQTRRAESMRKSITPTDSWYSRMIPTFRSDDGAQEIQGLEALEYQMARNLENLHQRRSDGAFAKTFRGKVYFFSGRVFAMYCLFRVFNSLFNVIFVGPPDASRSTNYSDLITQLLAYLVSLVSVNIEKEDMSRLARQISLGLVGIIILSSLRLVLRGVTRALRITSRNLGASVMLLILGQLMGLYLLSTIVQLRTSFPPPAADPTEHITANLFSTIPEFEVFGAMFNWAFLLSAGVSAAVRWFGEKVDGFSDE